MKIKSLSSILTLFILLSSCQNNPKAVDKGSQIAQQENLGVSHNKNSEDIKPNKVSLVTKILWIGNP